MGILLILVPISLCLLALAMGAFVWAVRHGQFDDVDTAAIDILASDPSEPVIAEAAPTAGDADAD